MKKQKELPHILNKVAPATGSFCFYCQVDSAELKFFIFALIGGLVFASLSAFIGLYLRGKFKNNEDIKHEIFNYEQRE